MRCWPCAIATVVVGDGRVLKGATVLVRGETIIAVGSEGSVPADTRVVGLHGRTVYPGLIDLNLVLGLTEVPGVAESNDYSEPGELNPQLLVFDAFNVDSVYVEINRLAGVTAALSTPVGGILPGQTALMSLARWTLEK